METNSDFLFLSFLRESFFPLHLSKVFSLDAELRRKKPLRASMFRASHRPLTLGPCTGLSSASFEYSKHERSVPVEVQVIGEHSAARGSEEKSLGLDPGSDTCSL